MVVVVVVVVEVVVVLVVVLVMVLVGTDSCQSILVVASLRCRGSSILQFVMIQHRTLSSQHNTTSLPGFRRDHLAEAMSIDHVSLSQVAWSRLMMCSEWYS